MLASVDTPDPRSVSLTSASIDIHVRHIEALPIQSFEKRVNVLIRDAVEHGRNCGFVALSKSAAILLYLDLAVIKAHAADRSRRSAPTSSRKRPSSIFT